MYLKSGPISKPPPAGSIGGSRGKEYWANRVAKDFGIVETENHGLAFADTVRKRKMQEAAEIGAAEKEALSDAGSTVVKTPPASEEDV